MKKATTLLLFVSLCSLLSCNKTPKNSAPEWTSIKIVSEYDTQITIDRDTDISFIKVKYAGSFFSPLPKGAKVKIDTFSASFNKADRDSIFSIVNDLIDHPAQTKNFCTEYVGYLKMTISYSKNENLSVEHSVEYSSVCNWIELSDQTRRLHALLRKRINKTYLGEHDHK